MHVCMNVCTQVCMYTHNIYIDIIFSICSGLAVQGLGLSDSVGVQR